MPLLGQCGQSFVKQHNSHNQAAFEPWNRATRGDTVVCLRLGWTSLLDKIVVIKYWNVLEGTFDIGWYDMCPVSLVNAPKWDQTNNLTLCGANIRLPLAMIRCQNQHSHWIAGLKPGLDLRKIELNSFISLQVGAVLMLCASNLSKYYNKYFSKPFGNEVKVPFS